MMVENLGLLDTYSNQLEELGFIVWLLSDEYMDVCPHHLVSLHFS